MKPEHSFYLQRLQLILLLSLLDSRPVVCFSLGDLSQVTRETWEQVALSLTKDGFLSIGERRPAFRSDVRALLEGMKGARRILAVYSGREHTRADILYLGQTVVALETLTPWEYRLGQLDALTEQWLSQAAQLPRRLPDPADAQTLMEKDSEVARRLEELEQSALPVEEQASAWADNPCATAVTDLFGSEGELLSRRVWLDDPLCPAVLWQNALGCKAQLDSCEVRGRFLRECQGD